MAAVNNASTGGDAPEEKLDVGNFVINVSSEDLAKVKNQIGEILQAQIILRGDKKLGYGSVSFGDPSSAASGDIVGEGKVTRGGKRGKGAARARGTSRRAAGRARRSADDPASLEDATAEEPAENGTGSVKAVTEGVEKLTVGEGDKSARGGKTRGRGRGAAKAAKPRKERGEPSKTLVFIRNLPYSFNEESLGSLFSSNSLSYTNLSIPVWKYGPRKGKGRGYAFATVSSEEEQKKVIDTLTGKEIGTGENVKPEEGAAEGAEPVERKLKIVARQGYENEEKATEQEHEEEAAGTNGTGVEDSGTAEHVSA